MQKVKFMTGFYFCFNSKSVCLQRIKVNCVNFHAVRKDVEKRVFKPRPVVRFYRLQSSWMIGDCEEVSSEATLVCVCVCVKQRDTCWTYLLS